MYDLVRHRAWYHILRAIGIMLACYKEHVELADLRYCPSSYPLPSGCTYAHLSPHKPRCQLLSPLFQFIREVCVLSKNPRPHKSRTVATRNLGKYVSRWASPRPSRAYGIPIYDKAIFTSSSSSSMKEPVCMENATESGCTK